MLDKGLGPTSGPPFSFFLGIALVAFVVCFGIAEIQKAPTPSLASSASLSPSPTPDKATP